MTKIRMDMCRDTAGVAQSRDVVLDCPRDVVLDSLATSCWAVRCDVTTFAQYDSCCPSRRRDV